MKFNYRIYPNQKSKITGSVKRGAFESTYWQMGVLFWVIVAGSAILIFVGSAKLIEIYANFLDFLYSPLPESTYVWLHPSTNLGLVGICLTPIVLTLLLASPLYLLNIHRVNNKSRNDDAIALTNKANDILKSINQLYDQLPYDLLMAAKLLYDAKDEYEENAYSIYWDRVEKSASYIAKFQADLKKLLDEYQKYYQTLNGRSHNFPNLPKPADVFPNPILLFQEFQRVVRLGLRKFEFASIYEQRKTQRTLISGFNSLGEAINSLSTRIDVAFFELSNSFDAYSRGMAQEISDTRDIFASKMDKQNKTTKELHETLRKLERDRM